jgi:hypothetical protein
MKRASRVLFEATNKRRVLIAFDLSANDGSAKLQNLPPKRSEQTR